MDKIRIGDRVAYKYQNQSDLKWGTVVSEETWIAAHGLSGGITAVAEPIYANFEDAHGSHIGWIEGKSVAAHIPLGNPCAECDDFTEAEDDYLCRSCRG